MMVAQLRGKIFWHKMNADINKLISKCDPCQRHHRSHAKNVKEVSHKSKFNLWPGHTVHMDFCQYYWKDFIFMLDRLTGFIQTANQGTLSAIPPILLEEVHVNYMPCPQAKHQSIADFFPILGVGSVVPLAGITFGDQFVYARRSYWPR